MIIKSMKFRGHGPFKNEFVGFEEIRSVNVIIGRNNSGKSHLVDLVHVMCDPTLPRSGIEVQCESVLTVDALQSQFSSRSWGNDLPGSHWDDNGAWLVEEPISWTLTDNNRIKECVIPSVQRFTSYTKEFLNELQRRLCQVVSPAKLPQQGYRFVRLFAERNMKPEANSAKFWLDGNGDGATNMIRKCIFTSENLEFADLIHVDLLQSLREVLGSDADITGIEVREHDSELAEQRYGQGFEVFLRESKKGLVPLSKSGSGLKTIILVLLNLLVYPKVSKPQLDLSKTVFAFEELENNLHPAVQRRLFRFIEQFAVSNQSTVFLTTHSPVAVDCFGASKDSQIFQVVHHGDAATVERVSGYFQSCSVLHELGARPSDMLQSNGIIWVEGPSDRIYINRWIDLMTGGDLREGRDYQCAFYGGSLLARIDFEAPDSANSDLANLLTLNPNVAMLCDSDRVSKSGPLKQRVQRVVEQFNKIPRSFAWVTDCKEIENYLPAEALREAFQEDSLPDPSQFEVFYPSASKDGLSYLESRLNRRSYDKVDIAESIVPHMTVENMKPRFDWHERIQELVERIREWNK